LHRDVAKYPQVFVQTSQVSSGTAKRDGDPVAGAKRGEVGGVAVDA
jgi:hypothetical protein